MVMVKKILAMAPRNGAPYALAVWIAAVALVAGDAQVRPGGSAAPEPPRAAAPAPQATGSVDAAFLKQYCITCHNERTKANAGGLAIDALDATRIGAHAEEWEKVVRKIKTGMMPPSGARRPSREALDAFAATLETKLDAAADPKASLETPALHRLNRSEYANAIRDLLDIEVNVAPLLPADGSSEGFDNIAEALGVSPSLIQGYVSAAMKISRLAVGDRTMAPSLISYPAPAGLAQDRHLAGLPLGTRGGMLITHIFPLDAEYDFTIGGGRGGGPGGGTEVTFDGQKVAAQNTGRFRMAVTAGPHTIGAAVVDRTRGAGVDDAYSDFRASNNGFGIGGGVQGISIMGPFNPTGAGDTPSRRRIFICRPAAAAEEEPCAKNILTSIARRAYRGSVSTADVDTLMTFYRQGRAAGDFESGVQVALARVLVAPRFIYRVEEEPANVAAGSVYRISDLELASRLSFFLWSSIPDVELLELASKGRLRDAATLQRQVKRMLADPKADALIENFAGQWLYLRELANVQTEAAGFDENLRQAFRRETEMLFGAIVREDRPIVELLDSDYTFVDERLARHYGMKNIRGSHFRRVTLDPASPRRGLLGHGSMLTVTSVATRTSPVMRGKWILENLLGAPPPEPPPGVETNLGEGEEIAKTTTLRQRLEQHRASPVCASCHNIMDPMGFALENYDLIGAWREKDGPAPIDSAGKLADGTPLAGPADLRLAVLSRSDSFVTTATEKLMIYALGRPMHHYDMPAVRSVVRRAGREGHRFSSIVLGIVESNAFQQRIKKPS
jgi:mono/diheme cytochrome c family protein